MSRCTGLVLEVVGVLLIMRIVYSLIAVVTAPVVLYWQYHDVQQDLVKIEKKQEAAFNRIPLPTQEHATPLVIPSALSIRRETVQPELRIIKTNRTLHHTDRDLFCMAKNIYHEAAREPELGKYAVAQITLNRKYDPKYPKSICSVILEPFQFSWANDHKIRWTHPKGPAWESSRKIAEDVIVRGYRVKGLERAMFYHADYVSPKWRDDNSRIAQVGRHIFYSRAL